MNIPAGPSTDSVLKRQKPMEWWYFGPVVLAIVMFLLMGTIFERRIEALYHRIIDRRQAQLLQSDNQDTASGPAPSTHTVKTPSQRTIGSGKTACTSAEATTQQIKTSA